MPEKKQPNALVRETSPYLLQHAYNPVQWEAWREPVLQKARETDTLLIISIGYAACHWCHVMERECFEDPEVAEVMNTRFIPVKVDREERPDVDQIYMDALQVMTGSGGWPLNIVALPDGRPFWGATYLPKDKWLQALVQLFKLYREDPKKVREYAGNLTTAVQKINAIVPEADSKAPDLSSIRAWIDSWKPRFDPDFGGTRGAPKFMMPVRLQFLMHWEAATGDAAVRDHIQTSLKAMALGGLFDHLGGGFARYSVDARWHVPHFEKMLYDNAQLISLYAQGYARYGEAYMKDTVAQTVAFIRRELAAPDGGYYASLDADSLDAEGRLQEGAYYSWKEAELKEALGSDFHRFSVAYNINEYGHWEEGQYVLIRKETDAELARMLGEDPAVLSRQLSEARNTLLEIRSQRPRPGLDDKIITSWNGLLLSGLADAARYGCASEATPLAGELADFLCTEMRTPEGGLIHSMAKGKRGAEGFLEDYAAVIEGLIRVASLDGNPRWMEEARQLTTYTLTYFGAEAHPLLFFNSSKDAKLIRRSVEVADNVIPASNSTMAKNLWLLGHYFGRNQWIERATAMLAAVADPLESYSGQHSNWLQLALWAGKPFYELAICGPEASDNAESLGRHYLPHALLAFSEQPSDHPLFKNRFRKDTTQIYLCSQGACQHPTQDPAIALEQLTTSLRE